MRVVFKSSERAYLEQKPTCQNYFEWKSSNCSFASACKWSMARPLQVQPRRLY